RHATGLPDGGEEGKNGSRLVPDRSANRAGSLGTHSGHSAMRPRGRRQVAASAGHGPLKRVKGPSDSILVSSAAILSDNGLSPVADRKPPAARIVLMAAAFVLVLTLIGSSYIYLEGTRALRRMTEEKAGSGSSHPAQTDQVVAFLVKNMDAWVKELSMGISLGGAGFVAIVAIGCLWWRHLCMRRIQRKLFEFEELNKRNKELTTDVQRQTSERRRAEQEVRQLTEDIEKRIAERTAQLAGSHEKMLKELNDRRQAERTMAQQAKELERSKDVLEMHVQVRGQEVQKLKSRYESILNSAGEGIYGLDAQGRTTFVNPTAAKITGWKVEELIGKLESEVFQLPTGSAGPKKDVNGEHAPDQVFFRRDGSSFPVEYMRTPIKEKD